MPKPLRRLVLGATALALLFSVPSVTALIPHMINFQGMLTQTDGVPLDGTYNLTFKIYGSESGTDSLWREYHSNIEVADGLFDVILGSLNPLDLHFDTEYWLGIKVNDDPEFSPRTRLTSVGYAFRAECSDTSDYSFQAKRADTAACAVEAISAETDGDWTISSSNMYSAVSGNVGIGTTSPAEKLDVKGNIRLNAGGGVAFGDDNTKVYQVSDDLYMTADDDLYLQPDDDIYIRADGDSDWIRLDLGNRRVGMGTMSPAANLDVVGSGGVSYPFRSEWSGSTAGAAILAKNTGTGGDAIQAMADGSGRSAIYARGSSGVDYAIWGDANGATWAGYFAGKTYVSDRVGIGTTAPSYKLDVAGDIRTTGSLYIPSSSGRIMNSDNKYILETWWRSDFGDYTAINSGYGWAGSEPYSLVAGANGFFFTKGTAGSPYGSQLVRIDTSGNVGIGTTNPGNHRLYVTSSGSGATGSTALIENTSSTGLAMVVENTSSDVSLLVSQRGTGAVLRCDSWTGGWHEVFKVQNDGRVVCGELELTGGSDLSEQFDIKAEKEDLKPGMLVSIDPEHPGELVVSTEPYDRKVAGVISGAGGIETGVLMGQKDTEATGSHPVALTGRVYCWADASNGPIQPGDLLTTSDTPGHAMKVTDYAKAQGAVIGKAMSSLEEGQGLVLVLATLQ
jgi:hypothetical protein